MENNGQTSSLAAAPTALSLASLHNGKDNDGGLDSMLMRQVRRGRDNEDEHRRFMTSLVTTMQRQQDGQHDEGGHGGGGNMLSCSPPPVSDQQNGGCNGFFEVDFI